MLNKNEKKMKFSLNYPKIAILVTVFLFATSGFSQIAGLHDPSNVLKPTYPVVTPILNTEDLTKVSIPNTTIKSVVVDAKGVCMITAIVNHPPSNDRVTVWIALPLKNWNGRFCGAGGGGFMAGSPWFMGQLAARGFAVGATDGGHDENEGIRGRFALDSVQHRLNWQEIRDYAYLGIHDMTVLGKALVKTFYGKPARYSYFVGGSNGGRQGLTEAQRYPDDYDGIVAYYPAIHFARNFSGNLWPQAVMNDLKNLMPKAKFDAVTQALITATDGDDGVVDGVLDDPFHCTWDPKAFVGTTVDGSLFTDTDADVVRKIWEGSRTGDGKFLWYGMPRGADLFKLAGSKGSPPKGITNSLFLDWVRYFLLMDPKWDLSSLTYTQFELLWNQSIEEFNEVLYAENPNLIPFRNHGGKLLIVHGLIDQYIAPQGSITYFEQLQNQMGGAKATSKFARLYLAPGVDHDLKGPGPKPVGTLDAVIDWVELGKAPDRIMAELKDKSGKVLRSRPLFPYPHLTRYSGSGSTDDAANFVKK